MTPTERGVYYDLLLLAKKFDQGGRLATEAGKPYPKKWIAARLYVDPKLVLKTIQKGVDLGLIMDDEKGIYMVDFEKSQSDYPRQKSYRQKPKVDPDPDKYIKGKLGHLVRR